MMPRVLFVDHVGVLGGGELSLLDITRHFRNTSQVILFEDGPFRERLEQAGVALTVLPASDAVTRISREGGLGHDLHALPGLLQLAWNLARRARSYDLLYANSQKSMIVAAIAGLLARKPVIWHLRDLMTADHFSRLHRGVTTCFARTLITRVIANSDATRAAFIESGGCAKHVATVYNGIDSGPFDEVDADEVEQMRKELALDGAPIVGAFSRLAPWKGQHVLLEALQEVPEVHVLLVGDALFDEDKRYAEVLWQQTRRLGLMDRVHFLGFREDVPQLMQVVDVVVHTSTAPEPFGRVIVEGMLAGKPVVATRAGGALEIIKHNATGLLTPPGDSSALSEALSTLLRNPEKAASLAEAGRQSAAGRFSIPSMLAGVTDQICSIVQG